MTTSVLSRILVSHKGNQDRRTPKTLFNELDAEFHFELDPCTSDEKEGWLGTPHYFTKEQDGLQQDWTPYRSIFINPPFNQMPKWVDKALQTVKKSNATIVMLVPAKTETRWFHTLLNSKHLREMRFVERRVTFEGHDNPFIIGIVLVVLAGSLEKTQPLGCGLTTSNDPTITPNHHLV
jgi:site-specific DNA-methyltransferase (adenine-specific)